HRVLPQTQARSDTHARRGALAPRRQASDGRPQSAPCNELNPMDATTTPPNDSVVIATFEKNKKEEVRVSVETFHGRKLLNIRVFYKDDDGTMKPGKQGLALGVDRYKDLASAILELGHHLKTNGMI